jgi:hypothetical protein
VRTFLRDLRWIVPASLGLGALLAWLDGGVWWIGVLACSFLSILGLSALAALWRAAGSSRTLGLLLLLALLLRLGLGVALSYLLPAAGYPTDVQQAGYAFKDAFTRDTQAWELASAARPLWAAFDKSYSTDQYGGLLAVSALAYRCLSPDFHRPWLVILLAALTAAIGAALAWRAARQLWGEPTAFFAAWIMALYPESLLLGSSQMREPFLITFIAMAFWGLVDWQHNRQRRAWAWMAGGLAGLLLFSPGVAVFAILTLGGWLWFRGGHRRLSWRAMLIGAGILLAAFLLLWFGLARGSFAGASPLEVVANWLQTSTKWDIYLLERSSGRVQALFKEMPEAFQLPFVTGYGLAQPVLPAAVFDESIWVWRIIGILRAAGWYALAPLLLYSLLAIWKSPTSSGRNEWLWLWLMAWVWIILSAMRAGGDQWDNPRYRAIFLLWQAALAAKGWSWQRQARSPWFGRILAIEGVFLLFFTEWYISRTYQIIGRLSFWGMVMAITVIGFIILAGGWAWDRWRASRHA